MEKIKTWVKQSIVLKILVIGFAIVLLQLPCEMIKSLIRERQHLKTKVEREVSQKWGQAQTICGPILTVPYDVLYKNDADEISTVRHHAHFLPEQLSIDGDVIPEERHRGLFEVVMYKSSFKLSGAFPRVDFEQWGIDTNNIHWDKAFLSIGIPDMRGIQDNILLRWSGNETRMDPGIPVQDVLKVGISARVNVSPEEDQSFALQIQLNGSKYLHFTPVGKETAANFRSTWPSPSFSGDFLPDKYELDENGFSADWKILDLNRNYPQAWLDDRFNLNQSSFGFELFNSVDEYMQHTRSAKYSMMIISMVFMIYFFFEIINGKLMHPIQYLLVGLSICIFYALLLSTSEHIGFLWAYFGSSAATIALIGLYSLAVLQSKRLTIILVACLSAIFAFVYIILQMETFALLVGTLGLFFTLALVMYLSRNINWYQIGRFDKVEKMV